MINGNVCVYNYNFHILLTKLFYLNFSNVFLIEFSALLTYILSLKVLLFKAYYDFLLHFFPRHAKAAAHDRRGDSQFPRFL